MMTQYKNGPTIWEILENVLLIFGRFLGVVSIFALPALFTNHGITNQHVFLWATTSLVWGLYGLVTIRKEPK